MPGLTPLPAPTETPGDAPLPVPAPPVFTTWVDVPLEATGGELLGGTELADGSVVLTQATSHGQVALAPDGSFTYVPSSGFVGLDSFWIATARGSLRSAPVEVLIRVLPSTASPSPASSTATSSPAPSADAFAVGNTSPGGRSGPSVSFGTLGPLDFAFEWLIPGIVVTLPGILVVLAVLTQAIAGTAWLPLVRREIGDFGLRRRRRLGS